MKVSRVLASLFGSLSLACVTHLYMGSACAGVNDFTLTGNEGGYSTPLQRSGLARSVCRGARCPAAAHG